MSESQAEMVDAEVVEVERHLPAPAPTLAVAPQVKPAELVKRLDDIKETMEKAMQENVDYGVIPGTNKPTLLKPGAEKLAVLFQLDVQIRNEQRFEPDNHLTVTARATVYHAPTGARLGYGEGMCTTRERKYAYRKQDRVCPVCGVAAIIKGKQEFGGGWLCWKKRDGCGAKFADGVEEIESQEATEVDNPDLPDLWNTVTKMAEKRARVDAVLAVTGASALFTQDAEDMGQPPAAPAPKHRGGGDFKVTPKQIEKFILPSAARKKLSDADLHAILKGRFGVERVEDLPRKLTDELVKAFDDPVPVLTPTAQDSDVPPDTDGLDQPPLGDDDVPWER